MNIRQLSLVISTAILIVGCGGGDDGGNGNDPVTPQYPYFPNKINTQWNYEIYDHLENTGDTITVLITGTTDVDGLSRQASIWTVSPCGRPADSGYANLYDTLFVVGPPPDYDGVAKDSVVIYSSIDPLNAFMKIMLPLEVDQCWNCEECRDIIDSSCVEEITSVSTDAGVFSNTLRIYELYDCGNEVHTGTCGLWIKPEVGIVKIVRIEQDATAYPPTLLETSWELTGYKITPM